jgi:predicted SAM-dependent methyltransferase
VPVLCGLAKQALDAYRAVAWRRELKEQLAQRNSWKIVVGADGLFDEGWIPTEKEVLNLLMPGHWKRYFQPDSIDAILAEHVWEHLTEEEGLVAARNCYTYLKPGGYLRVAVPDGLHPDPNYIEWVKVDGVGAAADDHKVLYTYRTLKTMFETAGFRVDLYEYYDEEGRFHYREWDPNDGKIRRSKRFDPGYREIELNGMSITVYDYTSLVLDAWKGEVA